VAEPPPSAVRLETDIVVIGAGQAGLSSAYHLKRRGLAPNRGFVVLDQSPNAGGAWQFRWPSLTLSTVNRIHDLPGMSFAEAVDTDATEVQAALAVPQYYAAYEKAFELPVYRPVKVKVVCDRGDWLDVEISRVTTTTWVTRRPPEFRTGPFDEAAGRAAVAIVEDRVRRGLPPSSVVSVTGLRLTPAIEAMRARGVLERRPMFSEITEDGVRWADGTSIHADVILWCTGFRSSLDHLAPLLLREPNGGIVMTGRLATQVAKDPRIHLVGYGPSASTIGANRAGGAAAAELMAHLGLP
jgi:glycine/D-amino acid oxidase-like deaminating enzyme